MWWNLRRLKSSDVQTRRRAIKWLSRSRNPRALAALMAALVDESHLARKEAAQTLGETGDAQTVKPLINLIEDSSHHAIVNAAVGALEKVLVRVAASVVSKGLQAAAALSDVGGIYYERLPQVSDLRSGRDNRRDGRQAGAGETNLEVTDQTSVTSLGD